jgi:hypothetical protein
MSSSLKTELHNFSTSGSSPQYFIKLLRLSKPITILLPLLLVFDDFPANWRIDFFETSLPNFNLLQ